VSVKLRACQGGKIIIFKKLEWTDPRVRECVEEAARLKARLPPRTWANTVLLSTAILLLDFDKAEWDGILAAIKDQANALDRMVTPLWEELKRYWS